MTRSFKDLFRAPLRNRPLYKLLVEICWDKEERRKLQPHGITVVPSNFYSPIPSFDEIAGSFEYAQPRPFMDPSIFDEDLLRDELAALVPHTADFEAQADGDEKTCADGFFWNNSQFSYSDAMAYYGYIRKIKPRRIVEIGSGFSTLVASQAVSKNGFGEIICIEPYPRPFLASVPHVTVEPDTAQSLTIERLESLLGDDDILFIDSTHAVKAGSDCLHLYLRLLPRLTRRVHLHVHDIFLPDGMPKHWLEDLQIYWTEQYLLLAWMLGNPRLKLLYGSHYHFTTHPDRLEALMHGKYGPGGSSVWLRYEPLDALSR